MQRGHSRHCLPVYLQELSIPGRATKYRSGVAEIRGATPADLNGVYDLLDVRSRRTLGISEVTLDDLRDRWARPGFAVGRGQLGRGRGRPDRRLRRSRRVARPRARRADPSVGDALLAQAEARASAQGFATITLATVDDDEPLRALAGRNDFAPHFEVLRMWRALDGDLPEPRWPDGVAVRSYTPADARGAHALLDDAYSAWDDDFVALPHDEWVARITGDDGFDPDFFLLAERGGELVGLRAELAAAPTARLGQGSRRARRRNEARGLGEGTALRGLPALGSRRCVPDRPEGDRQQPDRGRPALRACRFRHRPALPDLAEAAVTTNAATVSLLRWLRRQLREPTPDRERLEAAIANNDPQEARRIIARVHFSESQRHHVESMLDAWERGG